MFLPQGGDHSTFLPLLVDIETRLLAITQHRPASNLPSLSSERRTTAVHSAAKAFTIKWRMLLFWVLKSVPCMFLFHGIFLTFTKELVNVCNASQVLDSSLVWMNFWGAKLDFWCVKPQHRRQCNARLCGEHKYNFRIGRRSSVWVRPDLLYGQKRVRKVKLACRQKGSYWFRWKVWIDWAKEPHVVLTRDMWFIRAKPSETRQELVLWLDYSNIWQQKFQLKSIKFMFSIGLLH